MKVLNLKHQENSATRWYQVSLNCGFNCATQGPSIDFWVSWKYTRNYMEWRFFQLT